MAIAAALLIAASPVAAAEFSPELQKVIDGAKKEGKLLVSTSATILNAAEGAKAATAGMNKMFGTNIDVTWSVGQTPAQIGGKLLAEMQANQPAFTDLIVGTPTQFSPLIKAGLFRVVDWPKLWPDRIKPQFVEGNGTAFRLYMSVPAILYNRSEEDRVAKIASLEDFLKPEWKGKFYTTNQFSSLDVLILDDHWGEKKTTDFAKSFAKQALGLIECGAGQRIAAGEIPVFVIDCGGSEAYMRRYNGVIRYKVLQEFAQIRYFYIAVPKNAEHPNAAILYALWWHTPEAQEYHWRERAADNIDYPESQRRKLILEPLEAQGFKFLNITQEWWDAQKGLTEANRRVVKALNDAATQ